MNWEIKATANYLNNPVNAGGIVAWSPSETLECLWEMNFKTVHPRNERILLKVCSVGC